MRILHVVWGMTRGGLESMLMDICHQQAIDHRVHVLIVNAFYDADFLATLGRGATYECIERPPGSPNPWYLVKFVAAVRRFRPDIIHAHQLGLAKLVRFVDVPAIATLHDTRFEATRHLAAFAAIACISKAVEAAISHSYPGTRTLVVYNGIDLDPIRVRCPCKHSGFRSVQISRLMHEKKGQDLLLTAVQHVLAARPTCGITVDFIGQGPSMTYLAQSAQDLGIGKAVRFLGELSRQEVYSRLADYDLLVQPSRYEGFGLTIAEAMAAKVPVLVSDIEGPLEVIDNGRYGTAFKCGDAEDLAAQMIALIDGTHDSHVIERVQQASDYARQAFDIRRTAREYVELYRDLA